MGREALKGHLDMLLLALLRTEPGHGYAVIQRLAEASDGAFDLPEGTIYPALYRLERAGFLRSRETAFEGRRRRVYEITPSGTRALAAQVDDWRAFSVSIGRTLEAAG
ncbi:MAG: PadR family transcriptional regulator [Mycobacteriales bacterium]